MDFSGNAPDPVYRDEFFIAANKPAGLLAVPGRGADKQDCLSARLRKVFPDALVVHRLDMATSGLMVFARGAEAQRHLSRLFRERLVAKRYMAVVSGRLVQPSGEIALPLACDWPERPKQKVDFAGGKPSLTRYRVLGYDPRGDASRVALEPVTGRTHQLRVHMAAIGHPVLGDMLYGGKAGERAGRLLLHACALGFVNPFNGKPVDLASDPPF